MSVCAVVGSGETIPEEYRRLFGRLTRRLHLQPHLGIADDHFIEMPHVRPAYIFLLMSFSDQTLSNSFLADTLNSKSMPKSNKF